MGGGRGASAVGGAFGVCYSRDARVIRSNRPCVLLKYADVTCARVHVTGSTVGSVGGGRNCDSRLG